MPSPFDDLYEGSPASNSGVLPETYAPSQEMKERAAGLMVKPDPEISRQIYNNFIDNAESDQKELDKFLAWQAQANTAGLDAGGVEEVAHLRSSFPALRNLSFEEIYDNRAQLRQQAAINGVDFAEIRKNHPVLEKYIRDPEKAALALDASGTLQGLEVLVGRAGMREFTDPVTGVKAMIRDESRDIDPAWWGSLRDSVTKQIPLWIAEGLDELSAFVGTSRAPYKDAMLKETAALIREDMQRDYWGTFSGDRDSYAYKAKKGVAAAVDFVTAQAPLILLSEIGGGAALAMRGGAETVTAGLSGWRAAAAVGKARFPGVAAVNAMWFQPGLFARFNDATKGQSPFLAATMASLDAAAVGTLMAAGPVGLASGARLGTFMEKGIFTGLGGTLATETPWKIAGNAASRMGYHFLLGKTTFGLMEGMNQGAEEITRAIGNGESIRYGKIGEAFHEGWKAGDVAWLMSAYGVGRQIFTEMGRMAQAQETGKKMDRLLDLTKGLDTDSPTLRQAVKEITAGGNPVIYVPVEHLQEAAKHEGVDPRQALADAVGDGGALYDRAIKDKAEEIPVPVVAAKKLAESKNFQDLMRHFATFNFGDYSPFEAARWSLSILPQLEEALKLNPKELPPEQAGIYNDFYMQAERGVAGKFNEEDRKNQADTAARLVLGYVKGFQRNFFPDKDLRHVYDRTWGRLGIFSAKNAPYGAELERAMGPLFSGLERAFPAVTRKSGNLQAWLNDLQKKGAKPEEIEDSRLRETLEDLLKKPEDADDVIAWYYLGEDVGREEDRAKLEEEYKKVSQEVTDALKEGEIPRILVEAAVKYHAMLPDITVNVLGIDPATAERDMNNLARRRAQIDQLEAHRRTARDVATVVWLEEQDAARRAYEEAEATLQQAFDQGKITDLQLQNEMLNAYNAKEDALRAAVEKKAAKRKEITEWFEERKKAIYEETKTSRDELELAEERRANLRWEMNAKTDALTDAYDVEIAPFTAKYEAAKQKAEDEYYAATGSAVDAYEEALRQREAAVSNLASAQELRPRDHAVEMSAEASLDKARARADEARDVYNKIAEKAREKRHDALARADAEFNAATDALRAKLDADIEAIQIKYAEDRRAADAEVAALRLHNAPTEYSQWTMGGEDLGFHREVIIQHPKARDFDAHWSKYPGNVFHFRLSQYTGKDGKPILVIEEVQSDLHQRAAANVRRAEKDLATGLTDTYANQAREAIRNEGYNTPSAKHGDIPKGPFQKSWEQQAIKRILLMAVAEGHERIAWVTGQTSGERYNAGAYAKNVRWQVSKNNDGSFVEWHLTGSLRNGRPYSHTVKDEKLDEYVGSVVAEKMRSVGRDGEFDANQMLKFGISKGMEEAYDKRLPSILKKLGLTNFRDEDLPGTEDKNAPTGIAEYPAGSDVAKLANAEIRLEPDQAALILNGQDEPPAEYANAPSSALKAITEGRRVMWDSAHPDGWRIMDSHEEAAADQYFRGHEEYQPYKVHVADIPEAVAKKIAEEGFSLYERTLTPQLRADLNASLMDIGPVRGWFTPRYELIGLTPFARTNTLFHEISHAMRYIMRDLWNDPEVRPRIDKLYQDLVKGMGYSSAEKAPQERTAQNEEKIPDWFEYYVLTGNVPDPALIPVFARLFNFMADLARNGNYDPAMVEKMPAARYKGRGYGDLPDMPPEVKGVFDSVLLSAESIRNAEAEARVSLRNPLIAALMQDEERKKYEEDVAAAYTAARDSIIRAAAAGRARFIGDEKVRLRAEVEESLKNDPQYRMLHFFRTGELWGDEQGHAAVMMGPNGKPLRFNARDVEYLLGTDGLNALKDKKGLISEKGDAIPLDLAAQIFKFKDPGAMLAALRDALTEKDVIAKRTDAKLYSMYKGWLVDDPTALRNAALDGVHNARTASKLLRELRVYASQLGGERIATMMDEAAWQKLTKQIAESKLVGQLDPEVYMRAAADASERAKALMEAKDFKGAYDQQEKAVLNHYLYREMRQRYNEFGKAYSIIAERAVSDSWRAKLGLADPSMRRLHDALLYSIELDDNPEHSAAKNPTALDDFMAFVKANGQESQLSDKWDPEILRNLLNGTTAWKSLEQSDAWQVIYAIRNIQQIAKTQNELTRYGRQLYKENLIGSAERYLAGMDGVYGPLPPNLQPGDLRIIGTGKAREKLRHLLGLGGSKLDEPRVIMSFLGPEMQDATWGAFMDARAVRSRLLTRVYEESKKIWKDYDVADMTKELPGLDKMLPLTQVGLEGPYSKAWLMTVMRWMGSEESRAKMLRATGWNADQVLEAAGKYLTQKDLDLIQSEHRLFDRELKPLEAEAYERRTGLDFTAAKPMGYEITFADGTTGMYEGGYWPIKYDRRVGSLNFALEQAQVTADMRGFPATPQGHLQPRTGYVDVPDFNWDGYPNHVLSVIHDVAFGDWVRDTAHVLLDKRIKAAVSTHLGPEYYDELRPWLWRVARDATGSVEESQRGLNHALGWARSSLVYSAIGWNIGVAADFFHPIATGLMQEGSKFVVQYTIPSWLRTVSDGMSGLVGGKNTTREFAINNSLSLQNREVTVEHDLRLWFDEMLNPKGLTETALQKVRDTAFWHIVQMDKMISTMIWDAKYREQRDLNKPHEEAVQAADYAVEASMPTYSRMEMPSLHAERDKWLGSILVFRGYWSKLYQMAHEQGHEMIYRPMQKGAPLGDRMFDASAWAGRVLGMLTIGAVFGDLMLGHGPRPEEDWDEWFIRRELAAPANLIPFASTLADPAAYYAVHGRWKRPMSISVPAFAYYEQMINTMGKLANKGTPQDDKIFATMELALMGLRLPARAPVRALQYGYHRAAGQFPNAGLMQDLSGIFYGQKTGPAARNQELTPFTAIGGRRGE